MALTKKGGKRKVCPKYCRRKTLRCKSYRKPRKMHKKRDTKKMKGGTTWEMHFLKAREGCRQRVAETGDPRCLASCFHAPQWGSPSPPPEY